MRLYFSLVLVMSAALFSGVASATSVDVAVDVTVLPSGESYFEPSAPGPIDELFAGGAPEMKPGVLRVSAGQNGSVQVSGASVGLDLMDGVTSKSRFKDDLFLVLSSTGTVRVLVDSLGFGAGGRNVLLTVVYN